ncbi:hypothetical protein CMEL01_07059 [Colletotrichum melonis]|uniref:Uncharacterized protein n=1 Tax=Colletotrichum melonis TaxID=1209925 RepID=A0AAI9U3K2_9PEZI|nr:hypothetical protein CMEL01_07059 [Colletotrichum melonis]
MHRFDAGELDSFGPRTVPSQQTAKTKSHTVRLVMLDNLDVPGHTLIRTSSAISVSLGLDRAHSEVRKTGCTATQGQNIHAAAHLARLWCGGVSGPSLIRGRCNLTTEAASRFFKVDPLRSTT